MRLPFYLNLKQSMASILAITASVVSFSAAADFETNIGVSSKQLFRGQNLSKDQLSLKAGFDADAYGLYLGSEVATINVDSEANGRYDVYGGYQFSVGTVAVGLGAIYRGFEDASNLKRFNPEDQSSTEYTASIGWRNFGLTHYQDENDRYQYTEFRNSFGIASTMGMEWTLASYTPEVGEQEFDTSVNFVATLQNDSDMNVKLTYIHRDDDNPLNSEVNFVVGFTQRFDY